MRWLLLLVALGCGGSTDKTEPKGSGDDRPAPTRVPMPLVYGECSNSTTMWVSGPRPLPPYAVDDPPPPPEEDLPDDGKDDSGGTGQAMALDEGRMGRKPGEYHMKGPANDAELTRQQAIDAARTAGILGTTATTKRDTAKREPTIFAELAGTRANLAYATDAPAVDAPEFGTLVNYAGHDNPVGAAATIGVLRDQTANDKDMIRRYIHRNISKVTYCYEKQLLVKPTLAGTVTVKFFITPAGSVTNVSASGLDPDVASCVAKFVSDIKFPKPKGGGGVQVTYPFSFRPAGDDSAPSNGSAAPAAGSDAAPANGSGSAPAAGSGSATAPAKAPGPPQLFRSNGTDDAMYRTGATNDLREQDAALSACVRGNPTPYGAVVVELGTTPRVYGLDDAKTQACVLAVAKKIVPMGQRCSFAFGVMPPSALPGLDIAGDAVTFAGKPLALGAAPGPARSIVDAIRTTVTAAIAATAPVVAIHGPLVIRATDDTTVKVLTRVIVGVLAAGDDFVLATRRGGDWQLLDKLDLPVVPVALGSGGRWNRVMGTDPGGLRRPFNRERLSVLITKDAIRVGVSIVAELTSIPRDAAQWTQLEAMLKAKKHSPAFVDRTDIEIAADDDVTYGDLVKAIDNAKQAGFVGWQLTDPPGLSARPTR